MTCAQGDCKRPRTDTVRCGPCRISHMESQRRSRYGIEPEQFHAMRDYSGGRCHMCGELHKKMVVDHCHDTERVRGYLCQSCNMALGSIERLKRLGVDTDSYLSSVVDWSS